MSRDKVGTMDPAHVMDFGILNLGHPEASVHTVDITDMQVFVHGLDEIKDRDLPIAAIILSHGWATKAQSVHKMASGIIGEARALDEHGNRKRTRDLLVVTLDQRNHGLRRRVRDKTSFTENPKSHIGIVATMIGGVQDQQFVMDCLQDALFPSGERRIVEWMSAGVSMGGHMTWRLLRDDPRIRIAVPLITVPFEALIDVFNAWATGGPPRLLPPHTKSYLTDPPPPGAYNGKRVLSLHGELDQMIPPEFGYAAWKGIAPQLEVAEMWVQERRGHVVSEEMVRRTAEWFWVHGLAEAV